VLLHGKNFCGAHVGGDDRDLTSAGYRVIAPDQIGFCKSQASATSTPSSVATNTRAMLAARRRGAGDHRRTFHGRMLAARYALMFPTVDRL